MRSSGIWPRSHRDGSPIYAPWNALLRPREWRRLLPGLGLFGHWASDFTATPDGAVDVDFKVASHKQTLAAGESLATPMAFVGTFQSDLDNAGNESLDWQYRYLWDYTREGWFPGVRQAGWWAKGTAWPDPNNSRVLGKGPLTLLHIDDADRGSTYRKIFRLADLLSEMGADVYHRDCCWWDSGDNGGGPDFRTTGIYLRKHSMGQLIYRPINLDISKPDAVATLEQFVDKLHERYGTMEWRTDGPPIAYPEERRRHPAARRGPGLPGNSPPLSRQTFRGCLSGLQRRRQRSRLRLRSLFVLHFFQRWRGRDGTQPLGIARPASRQDRRRTETSGRSTSSTKQSTAAC